MVFDLKSNNYIWTFVRTGAVQSLWVSWLICFRFSCQIQLELQIDMAERNRQSLLPKIKYRKVYTEDGASRFKFSKKVNNSASLHVKTQNMKQEYLCRPIDHDPALADRFNTNYRSITLDVSHVNLPNPRSNIKSIYKDTSSQKVLSSIRQKARKRGITPSISTQMSKNHAATQAEAYVSHYMNNYKTLSQSIKNFIDIISQGNQLLQKTSVIVIESLLKLGNVTVYRPGQVIYAQKQPIKMVGLVLWGQAVLKKRKRGERFSLLPGHAIGEELIFQKKDYHHCNMPKVQKGEFLAAQKCKAFSNCGILLIQGQQYDLICQQLARQGYRDVIRKFQSLLFRTYLKKREFRHAK